MFGYEDIKSISGGSANFQRGKRYYSSGKISIESVKDDGYQIVYSGTAKGSSVYKFEISVDESDYIEYMCSCPAHGKYARACKHVIGGLIKILEEKISVESYDDFMDESYEEPAAVLKKSDSERKNISKPAVKLYMKLLLNTYRKSDLDGNQEELEVEYILEKVSSYWSNEEQYTLRIKIGNDKKYFISSLKNFMEDYFDPEGDIRVTNKAVFKKEEYCLSPKDHRFFSRIYEVDSLLSSSFYGESILNRKGVSLAGYYFDYIMDYFQGTLQYEGQKMEVLDFEDLFLVEDNGDVYKIDKLEPLTPDFSYIVSDVAVYRIPEKHRETCKFFQLIQDGEAFKKNDDEFAGFFSYLEKEGMGIKRYSGKNAEEKIYVSLENKYFRIKIEYDKDTVESGKKYLLKVDEQRHNEILEDLNGYGADVEGYSGFLAGEEKIGRFFVEGLPVLKEKYRMYLDENLKDKKSKSIGIGVSFLQEGDLLKVSFDMGNILPEDIDNIKRSIREKKNYFRLTDGNFGFFDDEDIKDVQSVVDELGEKVLSQKQDIGVLTAYKLGNLSSGLNEKVRLLPVVKKLAEVLESKKEMKVPASIDANLRVYQEHGYNWLRLLHEAGLGGVLADDMGLGKTLQGISFLTWAHEQSPGRSLVVVPTSLVHNWKREFLKFSPWINVETVDGTPKKRAEILGGTAENCVFISSYGSFKRDVDLYKDMNFHTIILDEAQHIKNHNTQVKKAVSLLKSRSRFAFTGTPMENSVYELWSIFDFVIPGYLYSKKGFNDKYGTSIMKEGDQDKLENLKKIISPFMLRREKNDVLTELPDKISSNIVVDMGRAQKKLYMAYLEKSRKELEKELESNSFEKSRIKILALLTRLRQICCSPDMFLEDYKGGSAKVELLMEILEELKESGHRPIIFSQFTKVFPVIKKELEKKGFDYFLIEGATKGENRIQMCEAFNSGEKDLFLISLKAGGTGLNLIGADTVIHFDPWWNPAVENQATDRAYRMGQKKKVQVIKLIIEGSIEEKILELQERKEKLMNSLVESGGQSFVDLSKDDILDMFQ